MSKTLINDNAILKAWDELIVMNQNLPRLVKAMSPNKLDILRYEGRIIVRLHLRNERQKDWFDVKKRELFECYLQQSLSCKELKLNTVVDGVPTN